MRSGLNLAGLGVWPGFWVAALASSLAFGACAPKAQQDKHSDAHEDKHVDAHEEGVVTLSETAQAQAGLRVAAARLRDLDVTLTTTGEVAVDADREAHVTGRVPGRVVGIHKRLGDDVRRGEALATIESLDLGEAQAEYLEAEARHDLARKTLDRQVALF